MSIIFDCPNCGGTIEVLENEIACAIFRHAYFYKKIGNNIVLLNQINPHTSKEECEKLIKDDLVVGCAKPFKLDKEGECYVAKICDYI